MDGFLLKYDIFNFRKFIRFPDFSGFFRIFPDFFPNFHQFILFFSDHNYGIVTTAKQESEHFPLISALHGIMAALEEVLRDLISFYQSDLDRNVYLHFVNPHLTSSINLGPFNLQHDSLEDIIENFMAFLSNTLQSYQSVDITQPSKLFIKMLSTEHMQVIKSTVYSCLELPPQ